MNIAVILAGGVGSRLGLTTPKQFFKVAGKMVIEHTIDIFEHHPLIDEIVVVSNPFYLSEVEDIVLRNGWRKVKKILRGGEERYESSLAAIRAYTDPDNNLIFHDAVRPLVSRRIIDDVIQALSSYDAVDVALPAVDTIIQVEEEMIEDIPDRSRLQRGQTPQAFKLGVIRSAYQIALKDASFKVTDDCGVVKKYLPKTPIYVVKGEEANMKLTYKEDIYLLDKFFQLRKIEVPSDSQQICSLKEKVAVVFGGSYGIGREIVSLLQSEGANVYSFSRSQNGIDISRQEDVREALRQVYEKEERIDCVIDTAGLLNKQPLMSMSSGDIVKAIEVNYQGSIWVAVESFEYLRATHGMLLFFTSSSYTRGRAFYSIYSSTKAAIVNFVQAIAQEWDCEGIKVNCINPERTKTPMRIRNFGEEPDNTLLSPVQVAEVAIRTLRSVYTGQVVDVKVNRDE